MAEVVAGAELLEVHNCRAVLIGTSLTPDSGEAASAPVAQFAVGMLRIIALQAAEEAVEAPCVVLAIADPSRTSTLEDEAEGGFYYPLLRELPVCKAGGKCLTFPDPESGDTFGILFDEGGLDIAVSLLEEYGCRVWQQCEPNVALALAENAQTAPEIAAREQHGKSANAVAGMVQEASGTAVGAIKLATGALTWGIRQATASAKQSPLMEPTTKPVPVPSAVRKSANAGREVSRKVVTVSGAAMDHVATLAGGLAGKASSLAPRASSSGKSNPWVSDAKYVGGASVNAGVAVFLALNEAADQLVQETLGSTSELVGHKLGEEAGATTREGFHIVGNVMAAKSLLCSKAVAKKLGKKVAVESASSVAKTWDLDQRTSAPISNGGIRLGPQ